MITDPYNDIHISLLAFCKQFIDDNYSDKNFQVFDFDSHASLNDLPNKNLIGISEYSLTNIQQQYEGECMLIISTLTTDTNLELLRPVVSKLFHNLQVGSKLQTVEGSAGNLIGHLTVKKNVKVLPVARTETRPFQAIALSFGSSFLVPP